VRVDALGRELGGPLADLAAPVVRGELRLGRGRSHVADEELDVREHRHRLDLPVLGECCVQEIARAVERRGILVVAGDEGPRRVDRRLSSRRRTGREEDGDEGQRADSHRGALYRRLRGASILTPSDASVILGP